MLACVSGVGFCTVVLRDSMDYSSGGLAQHLVWSILSILARMEIVASRRNSILERDRKDGVSQYEEEKAHWQFQILHRNLWDFWLSALPDECLADVSLYLREHPVLVSAPLQLSAISFAPLVPESATNDERELFLRKLDGALRVTLPVTRANLRCETAERTVGEPRIDKALALIQQGYKNCEFSAVFVSESLNISERHLRRLFKRHLGKHLMEYVRDLRIRHSTVLLMNSSVQPKAIAGLVGYKHYANFSRDFRRQMGITPSEFRSRHKP